MDIIAVKLKEVRQLLFDPEHWTKGAHAKDKYGNQVRITDQNARCWCLQGACYRVCLDISTDEDEDMKVFEQLLTFLETLTDGRTIPGWNDDKERRYTDVIDLLDRAIALRSNNDS